MPNTRLVPGARVRMLCSGSGDVDDVEVHYQPGALGTVEDIDLYAGQGVTVTISIDGDGLVNVFDQGDGLLTEFFELISESKPPTVLRRFEAQVRATSYATADVEVEAASEDAARTLIRKWFDQGDIQFDHSDVMDFQIESIS